MKNFLRSIVHSGIDEQTPFGLRNKLRVLNSATLVVFCIVLFYGITALVNHVYLAAIITLFSHASNIACFLLVRRGHYKAAFHYAMAYGFIFLSSFSFMFGTLNNSYYYFLFMPIVANIFFEKTSVAVVYLFLSAVMMITNVYYIDHYPPYYAFSSWMYFFSYLNIVFVTVLVFLGVRVFKLENVQYAAQIEEQKEILAEKNKEITDSIYYAKRIQTALLPSEEEFRKHFRESFVLFRPKDIVSGDFYWAMENDQHLFFAVADCTGHGVPGGFMTMLGVSFLDEIIKEKHIINPAEVLNALRDRIIQTLKQSSAAGESKDGMDIVLCRIDKDSNLLYYAAANNALYLQRGDTLTSHNGDKQPCGFHPMQHAFTEHEIRLAAGDRIYLFSDGYADQFGGPRGKKFKYKQLEELLLQQGQLPLTSVAAMLDQQFEQWRGELEQVDDVLVIGIRI